jgi:hypothetical protein
VPYETKVTRQRRRLLAMGSLKKTATISQTTKNSMRPQSYEPCRPLIPVIGPADVNAAGDWLLSGGTMWPRRCETLRDRAKDL